FTFSPTRCGASECFKTCRCLLPRFHFSDYRCLPGMWIIPPLLLHRKFFRFSLTPTSARNSIMSRFRRLRRDSRFSVHTQFLYKDKPRIERQQGRTYQVLLIPSRGALPPVRRTGLHTQDA